MAVKKNRYKTTKQSQVGKKPSSDQQLIKTVQSIFDGSFLTRKTVISLLPFLLYLTLLAIIYIANSYEAERIIIESDRIKKELKELRYEFITTETELTSISKQSEVAKRLYPTGIKESTTPPCKILAD
ncbi:MAG: hypothetical protein KAT48_11740 [Bacteroidales bacterium]|nr:hypothetical protein [Bacteroidales bacterium]